MEFTAKAIAEFLGGDIEGDPEVKVSTVAKIEEGKPGALSFLSNPKYSKYLYTTSSSVVLINSNFILEEKVNATLIRVKNAYESFAKLLNMVAAAKGVKQGIHPKAFIEPSASIDGTAYVGPFAYVGERSTIAAGVQIHPNAYIGNNVTIGQDTTIFPGAQVADDCIVGKGCTIHSGAIVGSDGFGFAPQTDGSYQKIPQIGNVVLEDNVDVGANTTIDRATMGSTIIRKGVKLDNLIQVAHNVEIGENTVIAAQSGIAGSSKIGKNCMFGGQVGISGHISIADGVKLSAQTGVPNSLKVPNEVLIGSPAMNSRKFSRSFVLFKRLPEIRQEIDELKRSANCK
ncbi:MAG TPA: UDP-3-O-(3-hydroxymyristoyl)glucosamine N-acyltransferase [Bacteroidetes bacterium]|nr:UDP-3-O-(3-hydroxymyristoyl)glucosamine N-acyltransferase [Bacteroidota bacterium]